MALKSVTAFPIFAPNFPTTTTTTTTTTTELRFSRWNNANAETHNLRRRTQHQIESDLRRHRRFDSALTIANIDDSTPPSITTTKSTGTPSSPSLPSIPGKKSKYSKPPQNPNANPSSHHPAFRKVPKRTQLPDERVATEVRIGEEGMTYVVEGAPFEFMYSYTETPKVKPIGLREPPVAPFGPGTMPRPWTGRKPIPKSKKELPEFDSFKLPKHGKKGVKSVQRPGPFLPGSDGPRYVVGREEVLGEPLTREEVAELVMGCRKTTRQLNMGRDGLTHNMLDNIHAHWKRRRVCKIKCKGVCTVDMDNVCQQLEERTGGKIIYRRGGIVYLFRGRNYNYKTRPRYPLMLWKPITPVYPRLIERVPEGLTAEEAADMRKRGRELPPICKLGKNGVYVSLAKNVREAFEACELVRINCQGLNPSDYRRIGAKLKDLVPCVLISFENEHILMWRGRDWKSSLLLPVDGTMSAKNSDTDISETNSLHLASEDEEKSASCSSNNLIREKSVEMPNLSTDLTDDSYVEDTSLEKDDISFVDSALDPHESNTLASETPWSSDCSSGHDSESTPCTSAQETGIVDNFCNEEPASPSTEPEGNVPPLLPSPCTEGVLFLLRQALENGSALVLDDNFLDADDVYQRSVALAQVAPPGPVFRHRFRKVAVQKVENQETGDLEGDKVLPVREKKYKENKSKERKSSRPPKAKEFGEDYLNVVPQGSLKIDELAKLLA